MHKAEIINPTETGRRLLDSMMRLTEGEGIGKEQREVLVRTKGISTKNAYRHGHESTTG